MATHRLLALLALFVLAGCFGTQDITLPEDRQILTGTAQVFVTTTGSNLDPDGYEATIDEARSGPIDVNGQRIFGGLPAGSYQVTLMDVAPNCTIQGPATQSFSITAGITTSVAFVVACA